MTRVQVFDPAMCCSTGICGPSVDPKLVHFAADLDWVKGNGVSVERFGLSLQAAAFVKDKDVKEALASKGQDALPLVKVDGVVKSFGRYPTRAELAEWIGIKSPVSDTPDGDRSSSIKPIPMRSGGCC